MKRITKYLIFILIVMIVTAALISTLLINDNFTKSKYIKRDADELRAYYTSLYFDYTGDGSVIALENGKGYITFDVMNYVDSNISERDIIYDVITLDTFYKKNGEVITDVDAYLEADPDNQLHALDVWGMPQKIQRDTHKYNYRIVSNSGPKDENDDYVFAASLGARTHTVTVEITQTEESDIDTVENVSVIIQLVKPYKQIYIINAVVSSRLIVFSSRMHNSFGVDLLSVSTQSADIFSYCKKDGVYIERVFNKDTPNEHRFTSNAFWVKYYWDGVILDENDIELLHNNQENILTGAASYKDITKPYVVSLTQDSDSGELIIYVPQQSDFSFDCFITDIDNYYFKAIVKIYDESTSSFTEYDGDWGGYEDESTEGLCDIILVG